MGLLFMAAPCPAKDTDFPTGNKVVKIIGYTAIEIYYPVPGKNRTYESKSGAMLDMRGIEPGTTVRDPQTKVTYFIPIDPREPIISTIK